MLTLGSLFDGIGGFPLSGAVHGIRPVWASEIEPFPILVTTKRFPDMHHLGSVTDIKGDEIEPVDIITFGSPCQDLSVAGAQKGIHDGARSSLFFEAVRIIKEMRNHDKSTGRTGQHVRPRFAVWENVPGAYSSNKGRDFLAVLQAICEVADPDVHVPFPQNGKWQKAGWVVGDGYSVAWRTYDAQYWGVPQRRKRIYLVADFGSERAGEILFEPDGVRGNPEESGKARQGTAEDAQGCAGGGCLFEPRSLMEENWARQDVKNALRAEASKSSHVVVGAFHLQQDPISNALDCMHDQQIVLTESKPPRKYIVRRLTPLECCRLQGYPDGWTENLGTIDPTEEEIEFFTEVWARWASINGTKPKSRAQVIKWLKDLASDSAEYKAYGNSLAIPCSSDVLGRIAAFVKEEQNGTD